MGTGKTKVVIDDLNKHIPMVEKVLVVSTRYSYADNIRSKLNQSDKLNIIQIDSMGKFFDNPKVNIGKTYVVLDEYESILQWMRFVNDIRLYLIVCNIFKYAYWVIVADA